MTADLSEEKKGSQEIPPAPATSGSATATLTVAGTDAKIDMANQREIDIHERDPNGMNDYVKIRFHDIIAEPDPEVFSFDNVWALSYKVFTNTKVWCYRITSLILAVPLAVLWGIYFACVAFCTAWCCVPCLKSEEIELKCVKNLWKLVIDSFIAPCFEAVGRCLGNIGVRVSNNKE